jgi:hypothetical protein
MRETSMVTHKLILLSIGQNPREINRARRTRCTAVREHLDATTAPIRRRGVVAFVVHGGSVRRLRRLGEQAINHRDDGTEQYGFV